MLQNLAGDESSLAATIAPLERRAPAGLPSLLDLQASFPEVARRVAAIELGEEGEGWSAGVLRRISEAVNLRPVGLVEGDQPTAVVARAEVKLNDGDLAGAVAELDGLTGGRRRSRRGLARRCRGADRRRSGGERVGRPGVGTLSPDGGRLKPCVAPSSSSSWPRWRRSPPSGWPSIPDGFPSSGSAIAWSRPSACWCLPGCCSPSP